jgi:hypothetical protein
MKASASDSNHNALDRIPADSSLQLFAFSWKRGSKETQRPQRIRLALALIGRSRFSMVASIA